MALDEVITHAKNDVVANQIRYQETKTLPEPVV